MLGTLVLALALGAEAIEFDEIGRSSTVPADDGWEMGCGLPLNGRVGFLPRAGPTLPVPESLVEDVVLGLEGLPLVVQSYFTEYVCAFVFVCDLQSSGQMRMIGDGAERAIILVSVPSMTKAANEWFLWKERSPYLDDPGIEFRGRIAKEPDNTRRTVIQYVLTHELGHVLHLRRDAPEPIREFFRRYGDSRLAPGEWRPTYYPAMSGRQGVPSRSMLPLAWNGVRAGGYPSPYAFTQPDEDFAESFALYVHSVMLGRPWELEVWQDGKRWRSLRSCWDRNGCKGRRELMERLLLPQPSLRQ